MHAGDSYIASLTVAALHASIALTPPPAELARNCRQYFTFTIRTVTFGGMLPGTSSSVSLKGESQAVTVGDTTFQALTLAVRLPSLDKVRLWLASKVRS
jgi:hypothetical protein